MEDVADAQARSRFERADAVQHLRQLRARHDAVLHVVVRRHAAHRGERRLAPAPDARALLVGLRDLDRRRAVRAGTSPRRVSKSAATSDAGPSSSTMSTVSASGKFGWTAASAARIASASIISDRRRDDAGADDVRHDGAAARRSCRTRRAASAPSSGRRRIRTVTLGHDRERALPSRRAAPSRSGPGVSSERAAEMHELAVGQHGLDAEHVMHREAVFQAVRAAGVLGDVAADRADLLARRIRARSSSRTAPPVA